MYSWTSANWAHSWMFWKRIKSAALSVMKLAQQMTGEWWILAALTSGRFSMQSLDRSSQRRGWMSRQWDGLTTCSKSTWKPAPTGVPQWSILSAILLSTFINNLNDGAECKFSKPIMVTKMEGVPDTTHVLPSIGHLMSWRNGLMQISWSLTMGGAKCCTWGGTTLGTHTCWGLPSWKAAWQERT